VQWARWGFVALAPLIEFAIVLVIQALVRELLVDFGSRAQWSEEASPLAWLYQSMPTYSRRWRNHRLAQMGQPEIEERPAIVTRVPGFRGASGRSVRVARGRRQRVADITCDVVTDAETLANIAELALDGNALSRNTLMVAGLTDPQARAFQQWGVDAGVLSRGSASTASYAVTEDGRRYFASVI